ncbi:hypothetical protein ABPG72_021627 [Tetrahymena utriculariae]
MNQKKNIKKDIFYQNIKGDDALYQQAQDLPHAMKQIQDKDKQKPKSQNIKCRNQQKDQSPNLNNQKKQLNGGCEKRVQGLDGPVQIDQVNLEKGMIKMNGCIYQSDQKIDLQGEPTLIDQLSLSKDIIKFNGPLILLGKQQEEEIKRATIKIQKLWKAKYHTIKKIKQEQEKDNENIPSANEFTFQLQKKNQNGSPSKNIKSEISPQKAIKKSPQLQKNIQSPEIIQKSNPLIISPEKQIKQGYLQKYQQKKNSDCQNDIQQEKIQKDNQKEAQQVNLKKDNAQNRDENKNYNQLQEINVQQIEKQPQQLNQQQLQQQIFKDQKKVIISNGGFKKSQLQKNKTEEKIKKAEKPYEIQNIIINNKQNQLEKRYFDKEVVNQLIQQNQVINLQKKSQSEQNNLDKNNQKEKIQVNPWSKQLPINVDLKKALIAQIISKQIKQQENFDIKQEDRVNKSKIQKEDKEILKWEQKDKEVLKKLVEVYGNNNWEELAQHMPNKTAKQCKRMYEQLNSQ